MHSVNNNNTMHSLFSFSFHMPTIFLLLLLLLFSILTTTSASPTTHSTDSINDDLPVDQFQCITSCKSPNTTDIMAGAAKLANLTQDCGQTNSTGRCTTLLTHGSAVFQTCGALGQTFECGDASEWAGVIAKNCTGCGGEVAGGHVMFENYLEFYVYHS